MVLVILGPRCLVLGFRSSIVGSTIIDADPGGALPRRARTEAARRSKCGFGERGGPLHRLSAGAGQTRRLAGWTDQGWLFYANDAARGWYWRAQESVDGKRLAAVALEFATEPAMLEGI